MNTAVDLRVVDECGATVPFFPDVAGPAMHELIVAVEPSQFDDLVAAGMAAAPADEIASADPEFYDPVTGSMTGTVADYLRDTHGVAVGIALHKLTNPARSQRDCGWWISVDECRGAIQGWEHAGRPDLGATTAELIAFLRLSAEHGGCRVWASM